MKKGMEIMKKDISDTPVGFDGRLHDARDGVCDWGYSW